MTDPNFIIIYVDNPLSSAAFYEALLRKPPLESHPTFAAFTLDSGITLGLWSKHTAEPTPITTGGGGEIAFSLSNNQAVDLAYSDLTKRGLRVTQKPTNMDFGYTFVVLDPDNHRLRFFCMNE